MFYSYDFLFYSQNIDYVLLLSSGTYQEVDFILRVLIRRVPKDIHGVF